MLNGVAHTSKDATPTGVGFANFFLKSPFFDPTPPGWRYKTSNCSWVNANYDYGQDMMWSVHETRAFPFISNLGQGVRTQDETYRDARNRSRHWVISCFNINLIHGRHSRDEAKREQVVVKDRKENQKNWAFIFHILSSDMSECEMTVGGNVDLTCVQI